VAFKSRFHPRWILRAWRDHPRSLDLDRSPFSLASSSSELSSRIHVGDGLALPLWRFAASVLARRRQARIANPGSPEIQITQETRASSVGLRSKLGVGGKCRVSANIYGTADDLNLSA